MKSYKFIIIQLFALLCVAQPMSAQSDDFGIWTSIEVKKKLTSRLSASVEGEYRTRDGVSETDRWAGSVGVDYKLFSWLKASAGYTYIYNHEDDRETNKGNIVSSYWQSKHRFNVSLTGSVEWNRFTFSLRERWQYTYRPEKYVSKYASDGVTAKDDELVNGKGKNVLRSRIGVDYDIRKCPINPFASCELYHSDSGLEKTRWTVGAEYKLSKKHAFELYYRYQDKDDDDETNGHVLGIGYRFKF